MRTMMASSILVLGVSLGPAYADPNDFLNQAQRFLNQGDTTSAYERGREDELRRQQAERDRRQWNRQPYGYRDYPDTRYSSRYRDRGY